MPRPHSTELRHVALADDSDQSVFQRQEKEDEEMLQQEKPATARVEEVIVSRALVLSLVSQAQHIQDVNLSSLCVSIR